MMLSNILYMILVAYVSGENKFPDDFLFGTATSAYQIEGAWNVSDKGLSIWDKYTQRPGIVKDGATGQIACDSYHKYKEDVQMLVDLGVDFYRFSLSWPRILPDGTLNHISKDGIDYYNNLINELIKYKITPMVTLYHWDMPWALFLRGAFNNEDFPKIFADYADLAFKTFGDRVKWWFTFNEPNNCCNSVNFPDEATARVYKCIKNLLLSHANAYHIYDKKYRHLQNGKIALVSDSFWYEPASDKQEDIDAAARLMDVMFGIWIHPIYHGDYPDVIKGHISTVSKAQGQSESRLPVLSPEEIQKINNTHDFFAYNYYSSKLVANKPFDVNITSRDNDVSVVSSQPNNWEGSKTFSTWLKVTPWGFRKCLAWIKKNYNDPDIYITENGYSTDDNLVDHERVSYMQKHLEALLEAVNEDNVKVKAYTAWSLMDNFEWLDGYVSKFGLYHVDFNDPARKRTHKLSACVYKRIIKNRALP